ncbi:hypothetical protein chiPu_0028774, partial [Chiloscyllium punctatum]|nr:hypothetical protein [Chiloscyllium punctatum]
FHSRMNLQLCFINDSSSESEAEETVGGASSTPSPQPTTGESSPTEGSLESRRKELESEAKRSLALLQRRLDQEKQLLRAAAERVSSADCCSGASLFSVPNSHRHKLPGWMWLRNCRRVSAEGVGTV